MLRRLILLAILIVAMGAGAPNSDATYEIISENKVPGIKHSIEIRLSERVDKSTLRAIAMELKGEQSDSYQRTFIGYYLAGMEPGAGAWATTHFNPDLEVRVLGFTSEEEEALAPEQDPRVLGTWATRTLAPAVITIERSDAGLIMRRRYKDGSEGTTPLKESHEPEAGTRYHYEEGSRSGEHVRINENGNLEFWDRHGRIETAKKR